MSPAFAFFFEVRKSRTTKGRVQNNSARRPLGPCICTQKTSRAIRRTTWTVKKRPLGSSKITTRIVKKDHSDRQKGSDRKLLMSATLLQDKIKERRQTQTNMIY